MRISERMWLPDFRWVFLLLFELGLWGGASIVFLLFYIFKYDASPDVSYPHLGIVFSLWLGGVGARLAIWRCMRRMPAGLSVLCAVLFFFPWALLVVWYVLVLVGLDHWGRVVTWSIVSVYLGQFDYLLAVFQLSGWLFFLIVLCLILFFLYGFYLFCRNFFWFDWCGRLDKKLTASGGVAISILCMMVFVGQFFHLKNSSARHAQEPIGVSFFEGAAAGLQSHSVDVSPRASAEEKMAFSLYRRSADFVPRNVILIVGDALRADHMGIYGYHRSTTPFLKRSMLEHHTELADARSVCAESFCGLLGIASSRYLHSLPREPFTLQEVLRRHGYKVSLILSGDHTNFYGLKEAYGAVDEYFDGVSQNERYVNDDYLVLDRVKRLPAYSGEQPVMFQFHFMSTHGIGLRHEVSGSFIPASNYYSWPFTDERKAPSLDKVPEGVNYYDNGVLQFDRIVHDVLQELASKGYLKNAVVLVTGDHGEMLGEKGLFGHQRRVYEDVLRVPFVLQRRGYVSNTSFEGVLASQVDIAPTILRELGISPPSVWQGIALQSGSFSRFIYFQQSDYVGVYDARKKSEVLKYWRDFSTGEEFLYDIYKDRQEGSDVFEAAKKDDLILWRNQVMGAAVPEVR